MSNSPFFLNMYAISASSSTLFTEPYLYTFKQLANNQINQEKDQKLVKEVSGLF